LRATFRVAAEEFRQELLPDLYSFCVNTKDRPRPSARGNLDTQVAKLLAE